jgi:prepilin-type N-terminal cleavage/methylation domain-containing protein
MGIDRRESCAVAHERNGGFSLVELMVVMVILTIGLIPLAFVQTRSQQNVADSGRSTEALALAQLRMESVKALGFGNAAPDSGAVDNYQWFANVQPIGAGPVITLEQVTVLVTWNEHGRTRNVQLVNMMAAR